MRPRRRSTEQTGKRFVPGLPGQDDDQLSPADTAFALRRHRTHIQNTPPKGWFVQNSKIDQILVDYSTEQRVIADYLSGLDGNDSYRLMFFSTADRVF